MCETIEPCAATTCRYNPDPGESYPYRGLPGIQPQCFILREENLRNQDRMLNVFQYLKERFTGNASIFSTASDSLARKGMELNDFMDGRFNDAGKGFLVAGSILIMAGSILIMWILIIAYLSLFSFSSRVRAPAHLGASVQPAQVWLSVRLLRHRHGPVQKERRQLALRHH